MVKMFSPLSGFAALVSGILTQFIFPKGYHNQTEMIVAAGLPVVVAILGSGLLAARLSKDKQAHVIIGVLLGYLIVSWGIYLLRGASFLIN